MESGKIIFTIGVVISISILILFMFNIVGYIIHGYHKPCLNEMAENKCLNNVEAKWSFFKAKPYYYCEVDEGNYQTQQYDDWELEECRS